MGTFLKLASTEVVDIVAAAGFDFAVADLEHSQLDDGDVRRLLRHSHAVELPMIVRVPAVDQGSRAELGTLADDLRASLTWEHAEQ